MNQTYLTNQRLLAFDAMKLFAIFMVIWGHCIGEFSSFDIADNPMYRIIYSFHMPFFMMISGYFATSSMGLPLLSFVKKKFRQLIYPCIIMGIIIWICIESTHSFHYQRDNISFFALIVDFYWFADFWFLKSCFICYCLAFIGIKSGLKTKYQVILTLIISQFIVPFCVSFMYPCFVIGMTLRENNTFKQRIFKNQWLIFLVFAIMLLFYSSEAWNKSHGIPQGLLHATPFFWADFFYYRIYRLLIGIVGALSFFIVFIRLFKHTHRSSMINILAKQGKYTLEIYILQAIILEKIIAHYLKFDTMSPIVYNYIVTPVCAVFLLMLFIMITKAIHKTPKLGLFLFGKTI